MSDSSTGQVLGAATAIGGIAVLPYTAGSPLLDLLILSIKGGMILALSSFILFRFLSAYKK